MGFNKICMDVNNSCKNYFYAIFKSKEHPEISKTKRVLATISFFTLFVPIGVAITLGVTSGLKHRVSEKPSAKAGDSSTLVDIVAQSRLSGSKSEKLRQPIDDNRNSSAQSESSEEEVSDDVESEAEPEREAQPEPQAEPQAELPLEPEAEQPAEPQPELRVEPQAEPEAELPAEPQPELRVEPQPEPQAEVQPRVLSWDEIRDLERELSYQHEQRKRQEREKAKAQAAAEAEAAAKALAEAQALSLIEPLAQVEAVAPVLEPAELELVEELLREINPEFITREECEGLIQNFKNRAALENEAKGTEGKCFLRMNTLYVEGNKDLESVLTLVIGSDKNDDGLAKVRIGYDKIFGFFLKQPNQNRYIFGSLNEILPKMRYAKDRIGDNRAYDDPKEVWLKCLSDYNQSVVRPLMKKLVWGADVKNELANALPLFWHLAESGDPKKLAILLGLLRSQSVNGFRRSLFKEEDNINMLSPILEHLAIDNPAVLFQILSDNYVLRESGATPESLIAIKPVLLALAKNHPEYFLRIFNLKTTHGATLISPDYVYSLSGREILQASLELIDYSKLSDEGNELIFQVLTDSKLMDDEKFTNGNFLILLNRVAENKSWGMLIKLLSMQDSDGLAFLQKNERFLPVLGKDGFLRDLVSNNKDLLKKILGIKGRDGTTLLYNAEIFKEVKPLLETLILQEGKFLEEGISIVKSLLQGRTLNLTESQSEQEEENRVFKGVVTPLHVEGVLAEAAMLISFCGIDLRSLRDPFGLIPGEVISMSRDWCFVIPKAGNYPVLDMSEYDQRALALKQNVLNAWKGIKFGYGEGEVDPLALDFNKGFNRRNAEGKIEISGEGIESLQNEIETLLTTMLDKIVNRTAWLGTPPGNADLQAFLQFYTPMLLDFETVITAYREKPEELAGALCSIAKVEFERRCAMGYLQEIRQTAGLRKKDEGGLTLDSMIKETAQSAYLAIVESIAPQNVHDMMRYMFAAKFSEFDDPLALPGQGIEGIEERILEECTYDKFISLFLQKFTEKYPIESLQGYLLDKTPAEFDEGYREIIELAVRKSNEIMNEANGCLEGAFEGEDRKKALNEAKTMKRDVSLERAVNSEAFKGPATLVFAVYKEGVDEIKNFLVSLGVAREAIVDHDIPNDPQSLDVFLQSIQGYSKLINNQRIPSPRELMKKKREFNTKIQDIKNQINSASDLVTSMEAKGFHDVAQYRAVVAAVKKLAEGFARIKEEIDKNEKFAYLDKTFNPILEQPAEALEVNRRKKFNEGWYNNPKALAARVLYLNDVIQLMR